MLSVSRHPLRLLAAISIAILVWRLAVIHALGITLYVDEAQYWTWAQDLEWGYFSKPPGVALLIAASTALFGDGTLGVKALAMLCYIASAWLARGIALRLFDEETGFWSAIAILTLPMFAWLGLFVSTDALLTVGWLAALWLLLRALDSDTWLDWLLIGVVCGLGLLSKYMMIAWGVAALTWLICFDHERLRSPKPWIAALVALLILSPNLIWNVVNDFPTLRHTAEITVGKRAVGGPSALGEFLGAQWIAFGPILGSAGLVLLFGGRSLWHNTRYRLLLWFALPLWGVVSVQAWKSGANANWAAPAFAPAAIAVVAWLLQRRWRQVLAAGLALNLLLVSVIYHWPQLLALAGAESAKLDPYARARGWDDIGRQLQPLFAAHPGAVLVADNRTVMAHLLYELRAVEPPAASWDPTHSKADHYKMSTDLNAYRGRDLIFVTRESPPDFSRYGESSAHIAALKAPLPGGRSFDVQVYLVREFKGY